MISSLVNSLKRGKTRKAREDAGDQVAIGFILALQMIDWEDGASSLDQSESNTIDKENWK